MWLANRGEFAKFFQLSWPTWLVLILALAGAAWLIFRIRARFRDHEDPAEDRHQMLMRMGELHREGGLSDAEFRSIKGRLTTTIDDSMRVNEPPR